MLVSVLQYKDLNFCGNGASFCTVLLCKGGTLFSNTCPVSMTHACSWHCGRHPGCNCSEKSVPLDKFGPLRRSVVFLFFRMLHCDINIYRYIDIVVYHNTYKKTNEMAQQSKFIKEQINC